MGGSRFQLHDIRINRFPYRYDLGIEERSGSLSNGLDSSLNRFRGFRISVRRDRIKCVGNGEHARPKGNIFASQALWITLTIPPLMVGKNRVRHRIWKLDIGNDVVPKLRVQLHLL